MTWANSISAKGRDLVFKQAWKRAQTIRGKLEKSLAGFFQGMVSVGVDVLQPPNLGDFTPTWEPLSDSWIDRKGGSEEFYFHTGTLETFLLGRNTQKIFGRPQVYLDWNGGSKLMNAGDAPKKYSGVDLRGMKIRVIPFPKFTGGNAEELTANDQNITERTGNTARSVPVLAILTNPNGHSFRPLVSPFTEWFLRVRVKNILKEAL